MCLRSLLTVFLLAIPRLARSVPVLVADNISPPAVVSNASSVGVLGPATTGGFQAWAMSFTTGADVSNLLQVDAVLTFLLGSSANGTATNLTVSIFTDTSGTPGTNLGALTFSPPPNLDRFGFGTTPGVFLPGSPLALAPTTSYWVVAEALSDATYTWNRSSTGSNAFVALTPGAWVPSSFSLATRVTVDALVGAPELGPSLAQMPAVFVAFLLGLTRRAVRS